MNDEFIKALESRFQEELPGLMSHAKMMSYNRPSAAEALEQPNSPRKGGVLLLLYPKQDQWHTVFIQRPKYKGVHSAQVSLPGGGIEPGDKDLRETALREAQEEVGIDPDQVRTIGHLSELYIPPSNFLVYPTVGVLDYAPSFVPEEREVEAIIECPVDILLQEETIEEREIYIKTYNTTIKAPTFQVAGYTIWGATAMILAEFKDLMNR